MTTSGPVLAISIESGRLAAGLVGRDGQVIVRDRVAMPNRDVWRSLERLIRRVLAASSIDEFDAVGVSCVGPIDLDAGSVSPPYVHSWRNFPLREHLEELTSRPVVLDSAAGAAALAERWSGEAGSTDSYLTVIVDAVVDSAVVIGGRRLAGAHGNAGSIAHCVVDADGLACWCGSTGCLEPYLSSIALEAEMNRPLRRATPSIVERGGIMLGRAIASTAATVDVDTVFVTGGVLDAFGDALLDACRREVTSRARLPNLADIRVIEPVEHISPLVRAAAIIVEADAAEATPR